MIQKTIKNHYIPVFYTKNWSDKKFEIIEFTRPYCKSKVISKRKHPSATGYQKNIYTLDNLSESTTTWIEDFLFKKLDNKASIALNYVIENSIANTSDIRCSFARLLFSLLRRNPEHIIKMRSLWEKVHDKLFSSIENEYCELCSSQNPETFDIFKEKYKLYSSDAGFAYFVYLLMSGEGIIEHLINCKWKFIPTQKGFSLLTSDRPVLFSSGALHEDFHILFACGPNNIFIATNTDHEMNRITKNEKILVKHYNDIVCRQANKYIYGCDESHLEFIEKRLGRGIVQSFW